MPVMPGCGSLLTVAVTAAILPHPGRGQPVSAPPAAHGGPAAGQARMDVALVCAREDLRPIHQAEHASPPGRLSGPAVLAPAALAPAALARHVYAPASVSPSGWLPAGACPRAVARGRLPAGGCAGRLSGAGHGYRT